MIIPIAFCKIHISNINVRFETLNTNLTTVLNIIESYCRKTKDKIIRTCLDNRKRRIKQFLTNKMVLVKANPVVYEIFKRTIDVLKIERSILYQAVKL